MSTASALWYAGDDAFRDGRIERAREALGTATALWRGEPLSGVAPHTGLAAAGTRLEQEYLAAVEVRIGADLAGGCHDDLVGELESLVEEHPYRERLWGHLMVALYRSGRQAEAIAAYQRVRELLRDELGLEPGGELRRIEAAVLRHELASPGLLAAASARRMIPRGDDPCTTPAPLTASRSCISRPAPGRSTSSPFPVTSTTSTSGGTRQRIVSCGR